MQAKSFFMRLFYEHRQRSSIKVHSKMAFYRICAIKGHGYYDFTLPVLIEPCAMLHSLLLWRNAQNLT